jgi:phage terminase large subunit GpA-like protein
MPRPTNHQTIDRGGLVSADEICRRLDALESELLAIPEPVPGSQWASDNVILPASASQAAGPMRPYGFQREILDALCDATVPRVALLKSAQVGYSTMLCATVCYWLAHDGTSVLLAQPTDDDVKDFARTTLIPVLKDSPRFSGMWRPIRRGAGETQDTLTDVVFSNGGILRLRGAASDDAFRRISTRVNLGDELDAEAWKANRANSQGDKLGLLKARGSAFFDSKLIAGGTPTNRKTSLVWREWLLSDQRLWHVPCPHCGEYQPLRWGGVDKEYGIKWTVNTDGHVVKAFYQCPGCRMLIDQSYRPWMDERGEWRPTAIPKIPGYRGYHVWAGMALHAEADWRRIAQGFIQASKSPDTLQAFVNLTLGEPWDEVDTKQPESHELAARREPYEAEVPDGVVYLVCGVDNQRGMQSTGKVARSEASVWGVGRGSERWLIGHWILDGEPGSAENLDNLDALRRRKFKGKDGREFTVQATCIDIGGGEWGEAIKAYASSRAKENVWPVKGKSLTKGTRSGAIWPRQVSRDKHKATLAWWMVDTQLAKDYLGRSMRNLTPGPGYVHLPESASDEYLKGLASEHLVTLARGRGTFWEERIKNGYSEPWDCAVYALAAEHGLKSSFGKYRDLDKLAELLRIPSVSGPAADGIDRSAQAAEAAQREAFGETAPKPPVGGQEKKEEAGVAPPAPNPVPAPAAVQKPAAGKAVQKVKTSRSTFMGGRRW